MSISVSLAELSAAAAKHPFGYLVATSDGEHAHAVAVKRVVTESGTFVGELGPRSLRNVSATLLWPPPDPGGRSLIVDGELDGNGAVESITIRPARAVLNRPAPTPEHGGDGQACGGDWVELSVTAASDR